MNIQCIILSVLSFLSIGLAQSNNTNLVCYDCDPLNSADQCGQPNIGVPQTNCNQLITNRDENSTLLCLSAYFTFTGDRVNSTGIYRGCKGQNSTIVNFCDWLKEEVNTQNIILTSCVTCNTSRCNNVTFTADGYPNGSSLVQMAFTVFGISLLFVLFF